MATYRQSEVQANGRKGTYYTNYGGIGLAYQMLSGEVVNSGGNGFYYPVESAESFIADDGAAYMAAVRGLSLPPAYKR